jgi:DNA-binding NarL/FixJ family response regulator
MRMAPKRANLILADDHPLMLMALKAIVDDRHCVIGTCENGKDLVKLANEGTPDVVITDIDMPMLNGIDAAAEIMADAPRVKVIFYTAKTNPASFRGAMNIGAHGYILKNEPAEILLIAIDRVMNGERFVSPSADSLLAEYVDAAHPSAIPDLSTLTARQVEILQLIGQGAGNKQIAHQLRLSVKTVEFHRASLMNRYGRHSIAELLLLAAQQGILQYPGPSRQSD